MKETDIEYKMTSEGMVLIGCPYYKRRNVYDVYPIKKMYEYHPCYNLKGLYNLYLYENDYIETCPRPDLWAVIEKDF